MTYILAALGAFVALVLAAIIVVALVFVVHSAWQHGQDTAAGRRTVVRRPLSDCTCKMPPLMKGQRADCPVHGGSR